jgi:hypothetical protein
MPTHDIIDNRNERLAGMKELRLLIGNTTNGGTFEQLPQARPHQSFPFHFGKCVEK